MAPDQHFEMADSEPRSKASGMTEAGRTQEISLQSEKCAAFLQGRIEKLANYN